MIDRIFAYGTLQVPQVIEAVLGISYKGVKARLPGYAVYRVRNAVYPGIVPDRGREVHGLVYFNISEKELKILDAFEGDLYERKALPILLNDGNQYETWVYTIPDSKKDQITDHPWSLAYFKTDELAGFMKGFVLERKEVCLGRL